MEKIILCVLIYLAGASLAMLLAMYMSSRCRKSYYDYQDEYLCEREETLKKINGKKVD